MKLRRLLGRGDDPAAVPEVAAEDEAADDDLPATTSPPEPEGDAPTAEAEADEPEPEAEAEAADADDGEDGDGDDEAPADEDEERTGQIAFELADWGARERKMIDEQLAALRVPRAWEAGTLVVAAADSEVVDDLIDEIEERTALDLPTGVEPVTYDVRDWPAGLEDRFIEALIDARVRHQRGYQEITVGVEDEEQVDALVEEVSKAWEDEQATDEELDGPDAQEVLSELFVSADRLLHDPSDRVGTVRFDDAAAAVEALALPFGFAAGDWEAVTARVTALRELLAGAESTDEEIVEAATDLRTQLRPLV